MKFTTYEQFKNASDEERDAIDPFDYTDKENEMIATWFRRLELELTFEQNNGKLLNVPSGTMIWLGLQNIENSKIIDESTAEFEINGEKIKGKKIIENDEYCILKEAGQNNFYKMMKLG